MTIFYKVGDPDVIIQTPNLIWDTNAGRAGLDEISVGNGWHVANVGNATALWNETNMTTLTINFNDTTPGKDVAVTVAANDRVTTGIGVHIFDDDEWQEAINGTIQGTMTEYFVENGDWTLNANGVKSFDPINLDTDALDAAD